MHQTLTAARTLFRATRASGSNVALVQSTQHALERAYAAEQERDTQILLGGSETVVEPLDKATYAVDFDFLNVLELGAVDTLQAAHWSQA